MGRKFNQIFKQSIIKNFSEIERDLAEKPLK